MTETEPSNAASLEDGARAIVARLKTAGKDAWWVGGCVRDRLLGIPLSDIDIATSATPDEVSRLFDGVRLVGASFGVCLVPAGGRMHEVATLRKDGEYVDLRRPSNVEWGTLEEDARRRDFTINALYLDPESGEITDLVGGRRDLEQRLLRTVGEPAERFAEDALRLLRAVRFAARFGFEIEPATWEALRAAAPRVEAVSPERIRDELTRMFVQPTASAALRLLDTSGLLRLLLPELTDLHGVEQGRRFHPEGDAWTHTLLCMDKLQRRTMTASWGTLLHDIGKAPTAERQDGKIRFPRHEAVGASMADEICRRLRFPVAESRRIVAVVERHMKFLHAHEWRPSTMRKFLAAETIEDDLAVHEADLRGSCNLMESLRIVQRAKRELEDRKEPALPPPLLTGEDLKSLGLEPGPQFGEILAEIQRLQLDGELRTLAEARRWIEERWASKKN